MTSKVGLSLPMSEVSSLKVFIGKTSDPYSLGIEICLSPWGHSCLTG
jgi:hypothetical protein